MGKRQHQKDKMYLTYTEWAEIYGGNKKESSENEQIKFKRLPFDHCALTMVPFKTPCCDDSGNIFEIDSLRKFLKIYGKNPVTGKPQQFNSFKTLHFFKNFDGNYHCPVLYKPFTKNSHIVAVAKTGNVFSFEAVEELNVKAKNWKDLVNDVSFHRKDILTLQNPNSLDKFDISKFYHINYKLCLVDDDESSIGQNKSSTLKTSNIETRETMSQLLISYKSADEVIETKRMKADNFNRAHYSTGVVAAGFTSTVMEPITNHEYAIVQEDLVRYNFVTKKGYVRLLTSLGYLNLEIFCDLVPKASENFIRLCTNGYYKGTVFHRCIKNFMIQAGDPTGTGKGGESIWKNPFEDEIKPNLSHKGRGILSMANSGPNSNNSQFFITFRSCRHLDGKHTIFGKVVGGLETLSEMEKIEVDNKDRPIVQIKIKEAQVFVDPFKEADDVLASKRIEEAELIEKSVLTKIPARSSFQTFRQGVGKYINIKCAPENSDKPIESNQNLVRNLKTTSHSEGYKLSNFNCF